LYLIEIAKYLGELTRSCRYYRAARVSKRHDTLSPVTLADARGSKKIIAMPRKIRGEYLSAALCPPLN